MFERLGEVNLKSLTCLPSSCFLFSHIRTYFPFLKASKTHNLTESLLLPKESLFAGCDLGPSPVTAAAPFLWGKAKAADISVSAAARRLHLIQRQRFTSSGGVHIQFPIQANTRGSIPWARCVLVSCGILWLLPSRLLVHPKVVGPLGGCSCIPVWPTKEALGSFLSNNIQKEGIL